MSDSREPFYNELKKAIEENERDFGPRDRNCARCGKLFKQYPLRGPGPFPTETLNKRRYCAECWREE